MPQPQRQSWGPQCIFRNREGFQGTKFVLGVRDIQYPVLWLVQIKGPMPTYAIPGIQIYVYDEDHRGVFGWPASYQLDRTGEQYLTDFSAS